MSRGSISSQSTPPDEAAARMLEKLSPARAAQLARKRSVEASKPETIAYWETVAARLALAARVGG